MSRKRAERIGSSRSHKIEPRLEPLEGRRLMSRLTIPRPSESVSVEVSSMVAGPSSRDVTVTLHRAANPDGAAPSGRLKVRYMASVLPSDAEMERFMRRHPGSTAFFPRVSRPFVFQSGQDRITVPLNLPPVPAGFRSYDVGLAVSLVGPRGVSWPSFRNVTVYATEAATPPSVKSARVTDGGLEATFSKAMDVASVENVANYTVTETTDASIAEGPLTYSSDGLVKLKSARYDPATRTVTLIPETPLSGSSYAVRIGSIDESSDVGRIKDADGLRPMEFGFMAKR